MAAPPPPLPKPKPVAKAARTAASAPPEVELAIRMRVAREKLAYDTSLHLTTECVSREQLESAAPYIHAKHYDGVLEERCNDELCAYPCCAARLKPLRPRQKYYIATFTRTPEVHLASKMHRFCSERCAELSDAFERSLSLVPVSQRDTVDEQLQPKRRAEPDRPRILGEIVERVVDRAAAAAPAPPPSAAAWLAAGRARAIEGHVPDERLDPSARAVGSVDPHVQPAMVHLGGTAAHPGTAAADDDDGDARLAAVGALRELPTARGDLSPFGVVWTFLSNASTPATSAWVRAHGGPRPDAASEHGGGRQPRPASPAPPPAASSTPPDGAEGAARASAGASCAQERGRGVGARGGGAPPAAHGEEELEAMLEHALQLRAELEDAKRKRAGPPPLAALADGDSDEESEATVAVGAVGGGGGAAGAASSTAGARVLADARSLAAYRVRHNCTLALGVPPADDPWSVARAALSELAHAAHAGVADAVGRDGGPGLPLSEDAAADAAARARWGAERAAEMAAAFAHASRAFDASLDGLGRSRRTAAQLEAELSELAAEDAAAAQELRRAVKRARGVLGVARRGLAALGVDGETHGP